jgi:hypothetical protein
VVWFSKFKKGQVWCGVVWFFWIGVRCGVVWFGKFRKTPGVVWCGLAKYFEKSVVWCGVASQTPNYGLKLNGVISLVVLKLETLFIYQNNYY